MSFILQSITSRRGVAYRHVILLALLARDSIICYSGLYAIARPSVRLSITPVDQSKTVEVRILQPSPQSSPMTLVF